MRGIVTRQASLWGSHWDLYSHPARLFSWDCAESSMSPRRALSLTDVRLGLEGPGTRRWWSYPESLFGSVNFLQSQLSGNKVRTGMSSRKMSSKSSSSSAAGRGAGRGLLHISPWLPQQPPHKGPPTSSLYGPYHPLTCPMAPFPTPHRLNPVLPAVTPSLVPRSSCSSRASRVRASDRWQQLRKAVTQSGP